MDQTNGMDSRYKELDATEWIAFNRAVENVIEEARKHAHKRPKVTTLLEEFSELILALRGKHDDPSELEIKQVSSVAINLLWQLYIDGEDKINNIVTYPTGRPIPPKKTP